VVSITGCPRTTEFAFKIMILKEGYVNAHAENSGQVPNPASKSCYNVAEYQRERAFNTAGKCIFV